MSKKQKAAIAHFSQTPWAATLLSPPTTTLFVPHETTPDAPARSQTQDRLFSHTLGTCPASPTPNSAGANSAPIPFQLGLYTDPSSAAASANPPESLAGLTLLITEVTVLYSITEAVNGFNGTVHGGFIACLVDEAMGAVIYSNYDVLLKMVMDGRKILVNMPDFISMRLFTASIETQMKKPIPTPGVVAVTASVVRVEVKKLFFSIKIHDDKTVFATAKGLWIAVPKVKAKV